MIEQRELLATVRANPSDDAPRLAFADFLDKCGDPRANLIRVQCRLATIKPDDLEFDELRIEEEALLSRHEADWVRGLKVAELVFAIFRRGFIESIKLRLDDVDDQLEGLSNSPLVSSITELNASDCRCSTRAIEKVLSSTVMHNLSTLYLNNSRLTAGGARAIAQCTSLRNLSELVLDEDPIGDVGIAAIAFSKNLGALRKLSMRETGITDCGVASLAQTVTLPQLSELDLRQNDICALGVQKLADSRVLTGLSSLLLGRNDIQGEGVRSIFESPRCSLKQFVAYWNGVGDEGVVALAGSPHANLLEVLDLRQNNLTDISVEAIVGSRHLKNLAELMISGNNGITSAGMISLARNAALPALRSLELDALLEECAIAFAHSSSFPNLKSLEIQNSDTLSDETRRALKTRYVDVMF